MHIIKKGANMLKYLNVIIAMIILIACGSKPMQIKKKETVFNNSLDRITVIQLCVDYLANKGLSDQYNDIPEKAIETDESWLVTYLRKDLIRPTRIVLSIDKKNRSILEKYEK